MVDYLEKYVKILKENNLKITSQRLIVLRYLDKNHSHPTADQIYTDLKTNNPSLSKTTVYNALDVLQKHGIIQALTICDSQHRYDINQCVHHHFLCTECGRIYDIDFRCPNMREIRAEIESNGHHIDEIHGYFRGICKNCNQKEKK